MPISSKEFESGRKIDSIEDFFYKNPNKAFSIREIANGVGFELGTDFISDILAVIEIKSNLDKMSKLIEARIIDSETYYMKNKYPITEVSS